MKSEGITPDTFAYTCALAAAADLENITMGKELHNEVEVIY